MMQIYKLDGNSLDIISCPPEDLRKGDYVLVEDATMEAALIAQVVNVGYADIPGILEDLLRETGTGKIEGQDFDILQVRSFVDMIKDAKLFRCKVRRSLIRGKLSDDISWSPSRSTSRVVKIEESELLKLTGIDQKPSITLGTLKYGTAVATSLSSIDGRLNIITGKKGTGKSHLSKLLVLGLVSHGGLCVIFDVNGEYINLGCSTNGEAYSNDKIL
ncbi:DUF87 domain-containing protein, partial [Candidatus Bathyarchaeota archaeon]|nr:DUF87 domain-containing protein [Candidatus Bathyarchaeota archaeon]